MARTVKGKKRFQFKITLVEPDSRPMTKPWVGSCQWKYRALYLIKMYLAIQATKASAKANYRWYKFYWVREYGAPLPGEFICPYSGMVAKTVRQSEAKHVRRYWAECARKTREILEWLDQLDPQRYTAELNHYLRWLVIIPPTMKECKEYEEANPFRKPRQWLEL